MPKKILIVAGLALVAMLLVSSVGMASAAPPTPTPRAPYAGGPYGYLDKPTLQRIATLLGTTPDEIISQLTQGKTILEIAQAKGVNEEQLLDTILAPQKDQLQLRVKYGYLTQAEADARLQVLREQVRLRISQPTPSSYDDDDWHCPMMRGGWGSGFSGGGFGQGMMGGGMMGGGMMGGFGRGY
ncbi:MAG: hypothetical protein M1136_01600 [Chloroflexi bacterium]|nr:hypothetical protein [Chloroflexota bacterium]MCL5074334.1 hypothetical protein [Chloroflexota bacterium]